MDQDEAERFIESWGSMGVLWGINRSLARIHAFLLLQDQPVDLDAVAQGLNISKGNASMSLKELRNWGVIQRRNLPGDRKDYYVCEQDMWAMIFRIAVERKKREFDPALNSLRHLLRESETESNPAVHQRLAEMEQLLSTMDGTFGRLLSDERASKNVFQFFATFTPGK